LILKYKICVVIPAFNASTTIGDVVKGAFKYVDTVIVADDSSNDDTVNIAEKAGAEVITTTKNRGKGNALKVLFRKAIKKGCNAVITMDADGQHDAKEIPIFIKEFKQYPESIILGSRMHDDKKIPSTRYKSMLIARFYISLASNQFIEDTQCGFRLYPLSIINQICLVTDKYITETEILLKAGNLGIAIRQVNVQTIYSRNGSHFKPIMDVGAITTYVIAFLTLKYLKEGITFGKKYNYSRNNFLDNISKYKPISICFQTMTLLTALPMIVFFFIENILLSPFVGIFPYVKKINLGFPPIVFASLLLPIVLAISIVEMIFNYVGIQLHLSDFLINRVYSKKFGDFEVYNK